MKCIRLLFAVLLGLVILYPGSAICEETSTAKPTESTEALESKEAFSFYLENDSTNIGGPGSDQDYSNGFKFSYIYADDHIPKWSETLIEKPNLLKPKNESAHLNYGFSLGHQIYTPENTEQSALIADDRPYAAWLYFGFAASLKDEYSESFLELDLGMIGPSAQGANFQNSFHRWARYPKVQGWANGLKDEPTIQLFYQKRFKGFETSGMDVISFLGGGFGNVQIGAHIGGMFRLGSNLPQNFGPSRPSGNEANSFISGPEKSEKSQTRFYGFGGGRINAIARNIFLDGNTFQSSHRVSKYPLSFETEFGVGLQLKSHSLIWCYVTRSPEFDQRNKFSSFASINYTYAPSN